MEDPIHDVSAADSDSSELYVDCDEHVEKIFSPPGNRCKPEANDVDYQKVINCAAFERDKNLSLDFSLENSIDVFESCILNSTELTLLNSEEQAINFLNDFEDCTDFLSTRELSIYNATRSDIENETAEKLTKMGQSASNEKPATNSAPKDSNLNVSSQNAEKSMRLSAKENIITNNVRQVEEKVGPNVEKQDYEGIASKEFSSVLDHNQEIDSKPVDSSGVSEDNEFGDQNETLKPTSPVSRSVTAVSPSACLIDSQTEDSAGVEEKNLSSKNEEGESSSSVIAGKVKDVSLLSEEVSRIHLKEPSVNTDDDILPLSDDLVHTDSSGYLSDSCSTQTVSDISLIADKISRLCLQSNSDDEGTVSPVADEKVSNPFLLKDESDSIKEDFGLQNASYSEFEVLPGASHVQVQNDVTVELKAEVIKSSSLAAENLAIDDCKVEESHRDLDLSDKSQECKTVIPVDQSSHKVELNEWDCSFSVFEKESPVSSKEKPNTADGCRWLGRPSVITCFDPLLAGGEMKREATSFNSASSENIDSTITECPGEPKTPKASSMRAFEMGDFMNDTGEQNISPFVAADFDEIVAESKQMMGNESLFAFQTPPRPSNFKKSCETRNLVQDVIYSPSSFDVFMKSSSNDCENDSFASRPSVLTNFDPLLAKPEMSRVDEQSPLVSGTKSFDLETTPENDVFKMMQDVPMSTPSIAGDDNDCTIHEESTSSLNCTIIAKDDSSFNDTVLTVEPRFSTVSSPPQDLMLRNSGISSESVCTEVNATEPQIVEAIAEGVDVVVSASADEMKVEVEPSTNSILPNNIEISLNPEASILASETAVAECEESPAGHEKHSFKLEHVEGINSVEKTEGSCVLVQSEPDNVAVVEEMVLDEKVTVPPDVTEVTDNTAVGSDKISPQQSVDPPTTGCDYQNSCDGSIDFNAVALQEEPKDFPVDLDEHLIDQCDQEQIIQSIPLSCSNVRTASESDTANELAMQTSTVNNDCEVSEGGCELSENSALAGELCPAQREDVTDSFRDQMLSASGSQGIAAFSTVSGSDHSTEEDRIAPSEEESSSEEKAEFQDVSQVSEMLSKIVINEVGSSEAAIGVQLSQTTGIPSSLQTVSTSSMDVIEDIRNMKEDSVLELGSRSSNDIENVIQKSVVDIEKLDADVEKPDLDVEKLDANVGASDTILERSLDVIPNSVVPIMDELTGLAGADEAHNKELLSVSVEMPVEVEKQIDETVTAILEQVIESTVPEDTLKPVVQEHEDANLIDPMSPVVENKGAGETCCAEPAFIVSPSSFDMLLKSGNNSSHNTMWKDGRPSVLSNFDPLLGDDVLEMPAPENIACHKDVSNEQPPLVMSFLGEVDENFEDPMNSLAGNLEGLGVEKNLNNISGPEPEICLPNEEGINVITDHLVLTEVLLGTETACTALQNETCSKLEEHKTADCEKDVTGSPTKCAESMGGAEVSERLVDIEDDSTVAKTSRIVTFEEYQRALEENKRKCEQMLIDSEKERQDNLQAMREEIASLREKEQLLKTTYVDVSNMAADLLDCYCKKVAENKIEVSVSMDQRQAVVEERDRALEDVQDVEKAFSELMSRYEKTKGILEKMKDNEVILKQQCEEDSQRSAELEEKYEMFQKLAEEKVSSKNEELLKVKKEQDSEKAVLTAMIRKAEIKVRSLTTTLEQTVKCNSELSHICEEFGHKYAQ